MTVMIPRRTRPALRRFEELAGLHCLDRSCVGFGRLGKVKARVQEGDFGVEGTVGIVGLGEGVMRCIKLAWVYAPE